MSSNPAPSFEDMPVSQQIEHVQRLWDQIAERQEQIPVPQWHRDELGRRLDRIDRGEVGFTPASDVLAEIRAKHS